MRRAITSVAVRSVAGWALLAVACLHGSAAGCDTPVYRYAMYRWFPAPYELYYFYDGQPDVEGAKIQAAVEAITKNVKPAVNLAFLPVDVQKDKELTGVPPDVKDAWAKRSPQQTPWYLISSPVGMHILDGAMAEADVASLIDSPVRQEIGALLEQGQAGVYLLLTGDNAPANEAAEKEIRGVVDDVAAGKIDLNAVLQTPADGDAPQPPATTFGFLKLARNDAAEKWLIDCLLALEPDLRNTAEPQVFLVYGRGRALFSCLGKGIQRGNLIQDVEFISGACSCTVKEQNPGVDLLIRYDWDAVAETLSQKFGSEEGSPYRFGGDALFPELIIPLDQPPAASGSETSEVAAGSKTVAEVAAATTESPPALGPPSSDAALTAATTTFSHDGNPELDPSSQPVAANTPSVPSTQPADPQPPATAWRAVLWVGAGLLGALVLLVGATFLMLRPR
ncbi:MAG: hypothetical protein ACYC4N_12705 [Pirellulaceae bacterium]